METESRKMPVGIQDFEKLRSEDYLYVDKTSYLYQLAKEYRPYFLARPRRFGKSLFISTLKAYFLGKKELFEGLEIVRWEKEWITYPVFHLDMNVESFTSLEMLHVALDTNLRELEWEWGGDERETTPASRLTGLIRRAHDKTGRKVVVLVDEYDKPLLSTMDDEKLNATFRECLKGFYGVFKRSDAFLRFVFLTGVTKFSKVSVFSDLNQLKDISLDNQYAGICGISEQELLHDFKPEIAELAKQTKRSYEATLGEIKKRYDGYHFAKKSDDMYNPFSMLNMFDSMDFGNYWFKTGTPTFLAKSLKNSLYDIRTLNSEVTIEANSIDDYRAGETSLVPLLYQSGYLTIKSYNEEYDEYTLGFPNEEVRYGFLNELMPVYAPVAGLNDAFSASRFTKTIAKGEIEGFMNQLVSFFASIPYDAIRQEHRDEQYYQHLFYLLFTLMGQFVKAEVKSAVGRADAVVKTADSIYLFEFKMAEHATAEEALAQIDDKGYLIPYSADGRRLVKIGVEFAMGAKGVRRWLVKLV